MRDDLGDWLRWQRAERGWNVPEMARRLRHAAKVAGDTALPGNGALCMYIRRWERGPTAPSERYKLHHAKALGIPTDSYGPGNSPQAPPHLSAGSGVSPVPAAGQPAGAPGPAGPAMVEHEVLTAAHESSEHAERTERRDIGEATLEQLRADVARLSAESLTGEPGALFLELRRVRDRVCAALERHVWPRDAAELYLLAGCLNSLMAATATALGYREAAEELIRAGWLYATVAGNHPLLAHLCRQHTPGGNRSRQAHGPAAGQGLPAAAAGGLA
jgi:transcriptional regulator with XRE-family HTH domain